jgi:hypothetical protein
MSLVKSQELQKDGLRDRIMTYRLRRCAFCGKRFMRFKSLIDHMIIRHSNSEELKLRWRNA